MRGDWFGSSLLGFFGKERENGKVSHANEVVAEEVVVPSSFFYFNIGPIALLAPTPARCGRKYIEASLVK
jgi:hypothetical protein